MVWAETPRTPPSTCSTSRRSRGRPGGRARCWRSTRRSASRSRRALELGADLVVCSDSKAMTGHGDLIMGQWPPLIRTSRPASCAGGRSPAPCPARWRPGWRAARSRLSTCACGASRDALAIAGLLEGRPDVAGVRDPGLPGHPAHVLACGRCTACSGRSCPSSWRTAEARRFLDAASLVTEATSSAACTRWRSAARAGDGCGPEGFIRLSAASRTPTTSSRTSRGRSTRRRLRLARQPGAERDLVHAGQARETRHASLAFLA